MSSQTEKPIPSSRALISAIIVSYNREDLISAVLSAVQFCDEVILVDKSSTDKTRDIALPLCDKLVQVAWSPTVEETRAEAMAMASHDWVLMLDDDEILNPVAVAWIKKELETPRALVYGIPQRHYIMGIHDPDAYYWPEHQIRFFNRSAVSFTDTVHGGIQTDMDRVHWIDGATGAGIEHLSHPDVASWIAKANRYTSRPNRIHVESGSDDLIEFAMARLDHWVRNSRIRKPGDYPQAAALLRAAYDIIDHLKDWEQTRGLGGSEMFFKRAEELSREHARTMDGKKLARRREFAVNMVSAETTQHMAANGSVQKEAAEDALRLKQKMDAAINRSFVLENELQLCKQELQELVKIQHDFRQEHQSVLAQLHATTSDLLYHKSLLLARLHVRLLFELGGYPRLLWGLRKTVIALRLLRRGRFMAHLYAYIKCKTGLGGEYREAKRFQKMFRAKIDPDGVLTAPRKMMGAAKRENISFPVIEKPVLSIIIPCYGQIDYTLRCLFSLTRQASQTPFEVIVVEDASGDQDAEKLRSVSGIRYIEREKNMGFLRSCNDAVKQARGDYIFLLNNDTYVLHGAVDALIDLLQRRPDAGMVGARLVYPDGIQQEAGAIVWQDGSAWNYGRRDDPSKPQYCYVREADYISGAAIMLSRTLWDKLGGFDEHYLPAYCEDNDLAFRIRAAGLKVLYQPDAWVIHYEGISHGTDINSGVKAYQVENMKKLKVRWNDIFLKDHFPSATHMLRARDRAAHRTVTLVVDHYVPEPDRDAGSRSIMSLIDTLLTMGRIVKFWPDNRHAPSGYTALLQQRGVEVLYGESTGGFARWVQENGSDIDEVLLSRPTIAMFYTPLLHEHTKAPIIFYGHDLHHARMNLEAEVTQDHKIKIAAAAMKEQEISVWKRVDYSLYPSEEEVCAVRKISPDVLVGFVSPYTLPLAQPCATPTPCDASILFVAGFAHAPNVDAAVWFCQDILPLIRKQKPNVKLILAGSRPTDAVKALANENIKVTGAVSDEELTHCYTTARVGICPLRFGGGVKFKVIEGMHKGLPLVTTPIGAQGLVDIESALEICDDAESFAKAVLRFIDDDAAWITRSAEQIDYVNRTFSFEAQRRHLEDCFSKIDGKKPK